MSAAGEFIVEHLELYGGSIGAIRGTVRDTLLKFPQLGHDEVTALASELWNRGAEEPQYAAIVLLQSRAGMLVVTDLTRLEGFIRTASAEPLITAIARDVLGPLLVSLGETDRARADTVLARWREADEPALRLAVDSAG